MEEEDNMNEKEELISSYSELPLGDKRKELGREIAEMTVITQKLINDLNPNYEIKPMEEFTNLFEESTKEDEYLTGLYQDVVELEEELGSYYDIVTDMYYEDDNAVSDIDGGSSYQEEENNKVYVNTMGYTVIWLLGLLTATVSIGLIIVGTFLLK